MPLSPTGFSAEPDAPELGTYVVSGPQARPTGSRPGVAVAKRLLWAHAPRALMVTGATLGVTLGGAGLSYALTGAPTPPASLLIAGQNAAAKASEQEGKARLAQLDRPQRSRMLTHELREGEQLEQLAAQYHLSVHTLRLSNLLAREAKPAAGTRLTVPPVDGLVHPVQQAMGLAQLATRYGVNPSALQALNPQLGPDLKAGDRVFIPGATALVAERPAPAAGRPALAVAPVAPAARPAATSPTLALSAAGRPAPAAAARPTPRAPLARAPQAPSPAEARGYRPRDRHARLIASRSLIGQFGGRVGSLLWPASGQLSSPFGLRGAGFHPGMDICNRVGTPIHAAKPGVVLSAGWAGGYGNAVDIDHGHGVVTRYGHCSSVLVQAGQSVQAGERIGLMGSTGFSTGPHVHFEVRIHGRPVNPATFF